MSVWKKLNKQDAYVTTYVAKKRWSLSGSELQAAGVKLLPAYSSFTDQTTQPLLESTYLFEVEGFSLGDTCLVVAEGLSLDICEVVLSGSVVIS